jgi:hypothetical protein
MGVQVKGTDISYHFMPLQKGMVICLKTAAGTA